MNPPLENEVFCIAADVYGSDLAIVVERALSSYRRESGREDLARIHLTEIGHKAFAGLTQALASPESPWHHKYEWGVEVRSPVRWHLYHHLIRKLIAEGHATNAIRDAGFSGDLGL
ncbi:hypothetical protein [Pseudomonas sp. v388]|uniref:hypothetical protein n=1 Tax=Pseudomonas sp. v388 TaxID=2479849 RepID=UPI000F769690|nr:hypothetical protein [Pseudomonas sp. v388]